MTESPAVKQYYVVVVR